MRAGCLFLDGDRLGIPACRPTAGGLGVLAGDTIRSAADLEVPMVAVSLIHRRGYFSSSGWMRTGHGNVRKPVAWPINDFCGADRASKLSVDIEESHGIHVRSLADTASRGESGQCCVRCICSTPMSRENQPWDRTLTDVLYGGDDHYRFCQELVLGVGGLPTLAGSGIPSHIRRFHMNEGHAALLVLALAARRSWLPAFRTSRLRFQTS